MTEPALAEGRQRLRSPRGADWLGGWRAWLLSALLYLPMAAVFAAHLWVVPVGLWPTGFVQGDQSGYAAMAREYFDSGFGLLYSLPFSPEYDSPRLYFQPFLLLLGTVVETFGTDPGRTYLAMGAVAGVIMLRLAIALLRSAVPPAQFGLTGVLLIAWGAGLITLAGAVAGIVDGDYSQRSLFRFDPGNGGWFLNYGRNLYYGLETINHALVLGILVCLLRRRFALAALLLLTLAASHPFTGIQFLLVAGAFALFERLQRPATAPPLRFLALMVLFAALHLGYQFLVLGRSPEHESLVAQWSVAWLLTVPSMALAYLPVAVPAALQVRREGLTTRVTLLLSMAGVSLLLAKHELFIAPRQPIHFTRGYIWLPLFLLGAPLLLAWLQHLWRRANWRRLVAAGVVLLLLVDNASFIFTRIWSFAQGNDALYLTADQRALFDRLNDPRLEGYTLVSDDQHLSYLALAYTPLRAWRSWWQSTPFEAERSRELAAWVATGEEPPAWSQRPVVFVAAATSPAARWLRGGERIGGLLYLERAREN